MSDPDLTPADEQVRRLLADARHDEPLPDDVADRLAGVLAELHAEARRTHAVADLAARRRRRQVARNVLVAAAAVVVLGVGIKSVDLTSQGSADDSGGSAASDVAPEAGAGGSSSNRLLERGPLVLNAKKFDQQVRRADLFAATATAPVPDEASQDYSDGLEADALRSLCDSAAWGEGARIPAEYDGQQAVLVLRAPHGSTREADLYLCGDIAPTRSTTVPVG